MNWICWYYHNLDMSLFLFIFAWSNLTKRLKVLVGILGIYIQSSNGRFVIKSLHCSHEVGKIRYLLLLTVYRMFHLIRTDFKSFSFPHFSSDFVYGQYSAQSNDRFVIIVSSPSGKKQGYTWKPLFQKSLFCKFSLQKGNTWYPVIPKFR